MIVNRKHEEATKTLEQGNWKIWNMRGSEMGNKSCRSDILIMVTPFLGKIIRKISFFIKKKEKCLFFVISN